MNTGCIETSALVSSHLTNSAPASSEERIYNAMFLLINFIKNKGKRNRICGFNCRFFSGSLFFLFLSFVKLIWKCWHDEIHLCCNLFPKPLFLIDTDTVYSEHLAAVKRKLSQKVSDSLLKVFSALVMLCIGDELYFQFHKILNTVSQFRPGSACS